MAFFSYLDFPSKEDVSNLFNSPPLQGLVLDIKCEYDSKNFEWYEFDDVILSDLKEKISDDTFKQLKELKDTRFSYTELKEHLNNSSFTEDEVKVIIQETLPYHKSDPTPFPDECKINFEDWQRQVIERLGKIRLTYIFLMHYFNKGIPDDNWCDTSGKNGHFAEYWKDFKDGDRLYLYMFHYYVNYIYYQIFSMFDNIYHLINIYYQMNVDSYLFFEKEVMKKLKIKNGELHTYLKEHLSDNNHTYKKGLDLRNSFTHNYLPNNVSSGITKNDYFRITDKTIKKFEQENTRFFINEKTLEKVASLINDEKIIIIKHLRGTPFNRKSMKEFLKKFNFEDQEIDLIIEHSIRTNEINEKLRILEDMKKDCTTDLITKDNLGFTSFNNAFITIDDPRFESFKPKEIEEILENSKCIKSVGFGIGHYIKSKEFKDNIEELIDLLSKCLMELKTKLEMTKAFQ